MYVDSTTLKRGKKVYVRHLLRTSYRENGRVKHKTVANLSNCSDKEIAAIKLALKHKANLTSLASLHDIETTLGKSIGAVWVLKTIAENVGVSNALGATAEGRLAMMQVIARVMDQGSRLSAVRLAMRHAVCEILGIEKLDEDDLYENLGWLAEHQEEVEWQLFKLRFPHETPTLFLYDVTSSYLEGDCNAFGRWGYNRDKKKGKKQIVVGLLTGPDGLPVAVRVFEGNTSDSKTVSEQVRILAKSFSVQSVTLVGDRGMLKGPQVDELPEDFRHITAITKPQIQKMLSENTLQLELFTEKVSEVETDGVRYILRRNPVRAEEMTESRKSKLAAIKKTAADQTNYLGDHPRADPEKALARVVAKIKKVKAQAWVVPKVEDRTIRVEEDEEALSTVALLDGCYVIKTDVPKCDADKQTIHDRYCDLQMVERAFRTMKTTHLELRPVFVTKKTSTQGHVFAVMLAFLVQRELERCWVDMDVTIREGIEVLGAVHMQEIRLGDTTIQDIPKPSKLGQQLLERAGTTLPSVLPKTTANVHTKKKLSSERRAL